MREDDVTNPRPTDHAVLGRQAEFREQVAEPFVRLPQQRVRGVGRPVDGEQGLERLREETQKPLYLDPLRRISAVDQVPDTFEIRVKNGIGMGWGVYLPHRPGHVDGHPESQISRAGEQSCRMPAL